MFNILFLSYNAFDSIISYQRISITYFFTGVNILHHGDKDWCNKSIFKEWCWMESKRGAKDAPCSVDLDCKDLNFSKCKSACLI